jgi:predicted metal-dependent hydrolase
MNSLTVGDLHFEVRRSPRRRSVQITVDRGGELLLAAPDVCSTRAMEEFVRERRFWIYTKLAEKEALGPEIRRKEYVSGEGFPYLGRSYRLLLVDGPQEVPVKLEQGRLKMRRADAPRGREHLVRWYSEHAQPWLEVRVQRLRDRLGVEPGGVLVQDLGFRWGSCGKTRKLNFHWRTILLPPGLVEYVVAHEVVHLLHQHHGPAFWTRLGRLMPDHEERRARLRALGPSLQW